MSQIENETRHTHDKIGWKCERLSAECGEANLFSLILPLCL